MKVIEPDFDRTVDLPGVGPTPRPVDIDRAATGFSDLLSLRIYDFADGTTVRGEAEEDEVLVVLLAGAVSIAVTGGPEEVAFQLDADGDWAVYLPPRHHYELVPLVPATVAYARARPHGGSAPRAYRPVEGLLAIEEPVERLRLRLLSLAGETDASAGLGSEVERLVHVTGPATLTHGAGTQELPPGHTLALPPGENAHVTGEGEVLVVAALRPQA
ncbi:5-deoxy-glucuronate isomerase [Rubellimicrobium arenae]|uniref:5-deoxy-glucuronate isomerase n=1 Tax=Rubellimicrobium arenae TaxID=2817372 RepID=UPI001B303ACA|nr:5-deoxy-glucuronate isomerase [Rubellimicrobium arenae]